VYFSIDDGNFPYKGVKGKGIAAIIEDPHLKPFIILFFRSLLSYIVNNSKNFCPICKRKLIEHSELQDKICEMITIKQFANNCPGFDVQFRPFFED
jgi:hypothetical protein